MLKDKLFNVIKNANENKYVENYRGEVEVKAWRNGELFYHDGGSNTVTVWARHSNIKLLSGNSFSQDGNKVIDNGAGTVCYSRPVQSEHSGDTNRDGCLISNEQYFWDWAKFANCAHPNPVSNNPQVIFPFFPTKMLFGTGFESVSWEALPTVPVDYKEHMIATADPENGFIGAAEFNQLINNSENYYSNTIVGNSMARTRTFNDVVSGSISELPTRVYSSKLLSMNFENQTGIDGPVKSGGFTSVQDQASKILFNEITNDSNIENYVNATGFVAKKLRGIGRPSFIYCKRNTEGGEIVVTADTEKAFDNRITFSVIMPEQTNNDIKFYPYNGYTLKEAGLFCDAMLVRGGTVPNPGDVGELPYNCMPAGIMIAKRKITPITKTADVKISVSWSLYL